MMKNKLNCVLLVDDDSTTTFITEVVLRRFDCAQRIVSLKNGNEAIDYLQSSDEKAHPKPELILLDINMPMMNGWEFIEEYKKAIRLPEDPVIMMLSSTRNELDRQKASSHSEISALLEKPFNHEKMEYIMANHFC